MPDGPGKFTPNEMTYIVRPYRKQRIQVRSAGAASEKGAARFPERPKSREETP